jgi:ketosteroid isomerase-like protein
MLKAASAARTSEVGADESFQRQNGIPQRRRAPPWILRAMSRENVEVMHRFAAGFEERGVDVFRDHCHPDIEWHEDPSFPESGVYRGIEAVEAYARQFLGEFSEIHYELVETIDSDDHVVANVRITGVGRTSGAEFAVSAWWAGTIHDGKIQRCFAYLDREPALEAVGLRE